MARRMKTADPMMRCHIRRLEEIDRIRAELDQQRQLLLFDLLAETYYVREGVLDQMEKEMNDIGFIEKQHDV